MRTTQAKIAALLEADDQGNSRFARGFAIDPTLYQRFEIKRVPTFVVTEQAATRCTEQACTTPKHAKISGDLSPSYILETMALQVPELEANTQQLLQQFKGLEGAQ